MRGLIAAEFLRMRKRRSLQVIVLAVPLLVAAFFVLGHQGLWEPPPFDAAQYRADLIAQGYTIGLPPEEAEQILDQEVEWAMQNENQMRDSIALQRATFVFPYSLVTVLGSATFVLLALVLLVATTMGDEFGWATIRTTLLANSHRGPVLLVRVLAIGAAAVLMFALLLLVGTVLPFVLGAASGRLPPTLPAFDWGALILLLGGLLLASAAVIGLATLATVLVRSGALTLVVVLVYVVVEAAILVYLLQFKPFQHDENGNPGELVWLLDAFPVRGLSTMTNSLGRTASGLMQYPQDVVVRDVAPAGLPMLSLTIVAAIFLALAFRRFGRMDIVE
jgi:hypothetical protein